LHAGGATMLCGMALRRGAAWRALAPAPTAARARALCVTVVARQEDGEAGLLARAVAGGPGGLLEARRAGREASPRARLGALAQHLLPKDFRSTVREAYPRYVAWYMGGAVFGTALGVLSMQSLLSAVGVGVGAVPAAAALNWVLKDGLGQLGGIAFASLVNQRFDAEPRRWRLKAALALDLSTLLEVLTPFFPGYFLPIAAAANVGKNVGWLAASATRASIHRSFMLHVENLADMTGKAGSQTIAASVLGTALGIGVGQALPPGDTAAVLAAACALSAAHLACTHVALRHVTVRTLNLQRLWLALRPALRYAEAPGAGASASASASNALDLAPERTLGPEQVAAAERVLHLGHLGARRHKASTLEQDEVALAQQLRRRQRARRSVAMRIGAPLERAVPTPAALQCALAERRPEDRHLCALELDGATAVVHVLLLVDATPRHALVAVLHAAIAHQLLLLEAPGEERDVLVRARAALDGGRLDALLQALARRGWDTDNVFLEPYRMRVALADATLLYTPHRDATPPR
jgi:hypothetical protein